MDTSKKHDPQLVFKAVNPTLETDPISRTGRTASQLLEDPGNCRQIINPELKLQLLGDCLCSEQQKLRFVLDWARSFLSGDSEVHSEFCSADSSISANEEQRERQEKSSASENHHPNSSIGGNDVFGGRGVDMPKVWNHESSNYIKSMPLQDPIHNQTPSQDSTCIISGLLMPNPRRCTHPPRDTNQTLQSEGATGSMEESTSCRSPHKWSTVFGSDTNIKQSSNTAGVQSERRGGEKSSIKVGTKKEVMRMIGRKGALDEDQTSVSEPEKRQEQTEPTSPLSVSCPLKGLSVYEQYQLYVDQLHHLRLKQSQQLELGSSTNPESNKPLDKRVSAAEITAEKSSGIINENQDRSEFNRSRSAVTQQTDSRLLIVQQSQRNITSSNKCGDLIKGTRQGVTSTDQVINGSVEHLRTAPGVEEAALALNPGLLPKRSGCNPGVNGDHTQVKCQKTKTGRHRSSVRLCEKHQLSEVINHTKGHTPEDIVKPPPAYRDTHTCPTWPTAVQKHHHVQFGSTSQNPEASLCDGEYSPAGVPACDWLCLPDELWLSILSLLPHADLCRVLQVCRHLHSLAGDHTLWRDLRMESSTLTDLWFLHVSRRRPRSLRLYSCCGLAVTSCGLEMFFTLCGKTLEELKVTSCTGPGLHGDQMLRLIGQLCDHVISVDVSWSGATDTGVKALSDCCAGLQLRSVVLNGCKVTDDPLMRLVARHKESLCRMEVFGCQFLTASCLQTVYEMCPGLQHLNIGQVPKVNAHSFAVMTSHLKGLISLNLTGLQAVTDVTVDALLQSCVKLQSLTLGSCPRVTDLTLHSIRKHTPCIRCLDVSGCKAITDAGVQSLALGCRRLQQLDLSSTGTGNRGVTLLANYCSRHLHTVKLSFCHITLENILKLCRRSKRLKLLHLYGCAHLPTERVIRGVHATVRVYPQA